MTKGLKNVLANLNKEIEKIQGATLKGMIKVGLAIKADAMAMTPVDVGPLRASAFSQAEMQGNRAVVRIGYTQKYAAWVHESPGTLKGQPRAHFGKTGNRSKFGPQQVIAFGGGSGKGRYWDGGEPKFLQKAVSENHSLVLSILAKETKIK